MLGVAVTLAMLSSLIIAPMAGAVSTSSVILSNGVISQGSDYTLTFDVVAAVPDTGIITVQFPVGTTVPATGFWAADPDGVGPLLGDVTLQATAGFGSPISVTPFAPANIATTAGTTLAGPIVALTITAPPAAVWDFLNGIGEGATVRIKFNNQVVTNPSAIASYTLTVKTNQTGDTTAVASQAYTLTAPYIPPLAGIVEIYNPSGILMGSYTGSLALMGPGNALASAGANYTIKIGPGTYTENVIPSAAGQTFIATGSAAQTLIVGNWTIGVASVTIDSLTLVDNAAAPTVDITATGNLATIQNCVFTKQAPATARMAVRYGNTVALGTGLIANNTFDTTLKTAIATSVADTSIQVNKTGLTISGNTFSVDLGDVAIDAVAGITAITTNTITGSSGTGIQVTAGTATITGATMTALDPALNILGGTTNVTDSTITNCGQSTVATATYQPAISVTLTAGLTISNSTITGSPNDILQTASAAVGSNLIIIMFNDLSGNTKGIDNKDTNAANFIQAPVNWWGSAAGPAALFNTGNVNASAPAGTVATGALVAGATAVQLLASATQGVDVHPQVAATGAAYTPGAGEVIAVGRYSANPGEATPQPALANGYYDVYFSQTTTASVPATQVMIKLYNPAITANTSIMVWSDLQGAWSNCTLQGINLFGGFAWATITGTSTPSILDLSGTPFALVEPVVVPVVPVIGMTGTPVFGAIAAPIQPTFTWSAVAGATSYEFVLAEEIGQDDKFAIIDYSATTTINGHVAREQLKYDTVYNWRVRAVNATGPSLWATSFFTTITEPVPPPEPVPPVIIKETPPTPAPEIILQVPPATKQEVQVIPDYLLWVVVAVGAVLIIAVVVLIVRTRRVV